MRLVRDRSSPTAGNPPEVQHLEPRRLLSAMDYYGTVRADGNDVVLADNGILHRVWRDKQTSTLQYATRNNQSQWTPAVTIDTRRIGGEMSIALDAQGQPAVAYYDRIAGDLRFARLVNGTWSVTVLDTQGNVGDFPSLMFGHGGRPFISYYDRTNGDLKLAWQSPSGAWSRMVIETAGDVGAYSSIAADSRGLLRIAYSDVQGMRLKYASQNPNGSWYIRSIDRNATAGIRFTSLAIDPKNDQPYIAYYDVRKKDLRVATAEDLVTWTSDRVATAGTQGEFANLFFDEGGSPSVIYLNRTIGTVNQITLNDRSWQHRVIAFAREHLSVAVSSSGSVYVSHYDPRAGLLRTTSSKHDHDHQNFNDPGDRIIHWEVVGGSSTIDADRRVGWGIKQGGWQGYVNTRVAQLQAAGMKRIFLHNPFGHRSDEPYFYFDQYIRAQDAGLNWLTNGFVEAWKPLTDSGVEVIAYIGKILNDPTFDNLTNLDDYMDRVIRSIRPLIDAGCSIGLDSIVGAHSSSRAFMVAKALRNSGIRVYAENRPPRDSPWWHDFGGVYHNDGYVHDTPETQPHLHWAASNHLLRGEIIRWVTGMVNTGSASTQYGQFAAEVISILTDRGTAATDLSYFAQQNIPLQALINLAFGTVNRAPAAPPPSGSPFSSGKVDESLIDDIV